MGSVWRGAVGTFWRLLPANPILVRVVQGASRRKRHLLLRVAYLGALLVIVLVSLFGVMSGQSGSLAELAKGASRTFAFASSAQLLLVCVLAPVFTAGAITQERDAQTFSILLSTPLSSAQIVFGSLMSRLYFVIVLLLSGLPIFLMTMVYGGVTARQVLESLSLAGATAILTGALAILIAMTRIGTRSTILSFYLGIAVYLIGVFALAQWSGTWVEASPPNVAGGKMSWLTPLHPFLALDVAMNRIHPPPFGRLTDHSSWVRHALAYPGSAYITWTLLMALVLMLVSIAFVRRGTKTGEPGRLASWMVRLRSRRRSGLDRRPRNVWQNPVAWREARTRTSGGALLRWVITGAGLSAAVVLVIGHLNGGLVDDDVRTWLAVLVVTQFVVAVIMATNTAATSMTKEKESKTLDLLLSTPLTSQYILWGKLRGLVSLVLPLLAGPILVLGTFAAVGAFGGVGWPIVWWETGVLVAALTVIYIGVACVVGLRISLVSRKNVSAVMSSVAVVVVTFGLTSLIGHEIVRGAGGGDFGAFLAPFAPITALVYLVDQGLLFESAKDFAAGAPAARVASLIGGTLAVFFYAFVVWSLYRGLVRSFDMIVRRQSST